MKSKELDIQLLYHRATRLYIQTLNYGMKYRKCINKCNLIDKAFSSELHKLLSK